MGADRGDGDLVGGSEGRPTPSSVAPAGSIKRSPASSGKRGTGSSSSGQAVPAVGLSEIMEEELKKVFTFE